MKIVTRGHENFIKKQKQDWKSSQSTSLRNQKLPNNCLTTM